MKILRLVVASLALAAGNVLAQAPAAALVDPEQKVAVKELLDAINFKQMMTQIGGVMTQQMPQMVDQMLDGFSRDGKLTPEQIAESRRLAQESRASMSKQVLEMYNDPQFAQDAEDIMARAYARYFTTSEIKATTAFYNSAPGRKALNIMPKMMQETMPEMMAMMQPHMKVAIEKMAKDLVAQVEKGKQAKGAAPAK